MSRSRRVRALLVGGPMYDPLYDALPAFERDTGYEVDCVARLPHPELNAYVREAFETGNADVDLLSTHTKYAPSQAQWLMPLDDLLPAEWADDLLPRPFELSKVDSRLLQVPRNLDVRLLHYRRDLFEDPQERQAFAESRGRRLEVPATWSDLAEVAAFFTRPPRNGGGGMSGFVFPGRNSGLFGTFYELLIGAGGKLFDEELSPAFDSPAGTWAAEYLADLYQRGIAPRELPSWHYDEISREFREGRAALVADWPGSYHLYQSTDACQVAASVGLAPLPKGPAGVAAAYAGCHSFAIPRGARNVEGGFALLRFLTSFDSQLGEARRGAIPCRWSALARIRDEGAEQPGEARRWALLAEAEQTMIIPPRFAAYPQCEDAIWLAVQDAMLGQLSPSAAVSRAALEVQAIVDASIGAL